MLSALFWVQTFSSPSFRTIKLEDFRELLKFWPHCDTLFVFLWLRLDQVLVVLRTTDSAHLRTGVQLWRCNLSRERPPVWFYDAHSVDNRWFVAAWALHLIVFFVFFTVSVFLKELNEHRAAGSLICSDSNFPPFIPEQDHQESGDAVRRSAQQPSRC